MLFFFFSKTENRKGKQVLSRGWYRGRGRGENIRKG
jgi:hypothetical protein